ncbi:nuclear receptor coactivator 6 [Biomphalaria pfeifferi]|uniref:Nuclear receptor coactivator 6 n=1 Tax=Biomphalaria pfeifferi TaxID=112525 RepID=A0AAD8EZB3_BIOPF|nr:nuclear receptor coactivator 6 [Biomphalaria pfeifferi]
MKNRPSAAFRASAKPPTYCKMESQKEDEDDGKGSRTMVLGGGDGSNAEGAVPAKGGCGEGRVLIFLVLGVLTLVFSGVLIGIYMNVRTLTSSLDVIEVMPSFVPAAAGGLAGLFLLGLFWKRCVVLVYPVLVLCAVSTGLSIIIAVLTGTHVLQPLLSVSGCVYTRKGNICQCLTQFKRDKLDLERVNAGETVYLALHNVSSCEDVQTVIPTMLYTMIGIHGLLALVSAVAGIISFLVYRTERNRNYLDDTDYDEDEDSSPSTPSSNTDNYTEHQNMLSSRQANVTTAASVGNIYTNTNATTKDEETNNDDGNTTPSDLTYNPSDAPMGYTEACKMRRCQSFTQPHKRAAREGSPGSSESSQTASSLMSSDRVADGGAIRLKENQKKGRRAVTLHGLDRDQLLLILSLQMRYLQESEQLAKKECQSALNLNNINKPNRTNVKNPNATSSDTSQENIDTSNTFSHFQRRAMTPTPRQERLSSSRATNDDLDYKPAKQVRSHTPQPYHFKVQHNGVPATMGPVLLPNIPAQYQVEQQLQPLQVQHLQQLQQQQQQQFLQFQQQQQLAQLQQQQQKIQMQQQLQLQQHLQVQQMSQHLPMQQPILVQQPALQSANDNMENESLTMITYDLRSVQTTGPIVYENVPSSRTSLNYYSPDGSCSSNSSSLLRATNLPGYPSLSSNSVPTQTQPMPQPVELSPIKVLGGNIQTTTPNSPGQISCQTSEISSPSHSGNDSINTEQKQPGKSPESTPETQPAKAKGKKKLSKKEKNAKKEEEKTATTDSTKTSTLGRTDSNASKAGSISDRWQAVLPDGKAQAQTLWENVQRKIVSDPQTPDSTLTFPHSSHPTSQTSVQPSAPNHVPNSSLVVPNGILKKTKSVPYSQQSSPNLAPVSPQFLPQFDSQVPSNIYSSYNQMTNTPSYNAFIPIATSSTDNYEDTDDFSRANQHAQQEQQDVPPPKPARLHARKPAPGTEAGESLDSQGQQLRPKSYLSAVDRESMAAASLTSMGNVPCQPVYEGTNKQSLTHMEMEGPVRDERSGGIVPAGGNDQFIMNNGDLYAQPRRKSIPTNLPLLPSLNQSHQMYQNSEIDHNLMDNQARAQYRLDVHQPQRSAFHMLGHTYHGDRSGHLPSNEICDTDLDELPIPRWNSRYHRSQSFSPPPYTPPPVYQSLELVSKYPSIRSTSSSSSDPHNSSSEGSTLDNIQPGFTNYRLQVPPLSMSRGRQPAHVTDRRFCLTQQRQPPPNLYSGHRLNLKSDYDSFRDRRVDQEPPPQVAIRRCQSVEEGNRKRLTPGQDLVNGKMVPHNNYYPNIDNIRTTSDGQNLENNLKMGPPVNRVRPIHNGSVPNTEQPAFQKGVQNFQNEAYIRNKGCQARKFPGDVSEEDLSCSIDTDSVISDSSPQEVCPNKELNGFITHGRALESSDSDKDDYAETVI